MHVGQQLIQAAVNPHEVLRILGSREVQLHLVHEVQEVYRSQGVSIHDKHIEIIIRQMLKRVNVLESGDTDLLPGELVERPRFENVNRSAVETGGTPASAPYSGWASRACNLRPSAYTSTSPRASACSTAAASVSPTSSGTPSGSPKASTSTTSFSASGNRPIRADISSTSPGDSSSRPDHSHTPAT